MLFTVSPQAVDVAETVDASSIREQFVRRLICCCSQTIYKSIKASINAALFFIVFNLCALLAACFSYTICVIFVKYSNHITYYVHNRFIFINTEGLHRNAKMFTIQQQY